MWPGVLDLNGGSTLLILKDEGCHPRPVRQDAALTSLCRVLSALLHMPSSHAATPCQELLVHGEAKIIASCSCPL